MAHDSPHRGRLAYRKWVGIVAAGATLLATLSSAEAQQPQPQPYPYPYPYPYPPPAYPYPYPPPAAYPPPTVVMAPPPKPEPPTVIHDWDPDAAPPAGYRMVDTVNGRLIGTGVALLASGWLISVLAASVGAAAEEEEDEKREPNDGTHPGDWTPMFIPVVGPFLAMGTLDPKPSGTGLLVVDGVVQTGGALCIVLGIVDRKYKVVRHDVAGVEISPMTGSVTGVSASGSF